MREYPGFGGGGLLLATANETLSNALVFNGVTTIAAAHGTTLDEDATSYTIDAANVLGIGAPGEDGTILWHTNGGGVDVSSEVDVQAGTLKAADSGLGILLQIARVDSGATIDLGGFDAQILSLTGAGVITNSRGSA